MRRLPIAPLLKGVYKGPENPPFDIDFSWFFMAFEAFWGFYPMILLVFTYLRVMVIVLDLSFLIFDKFLRFWEFWVLKNSQHLSKAMFKHV